jgi:hypothetical protein
MTQKYFASVRNNVVVVYNERGTRVGSFSCPGATSVYITGEKICVQIGYKETKIYKPNGTLLSTMRG